MPGFEPDRFCSGFETGHDVLTPFRCLTLRCTALGVRCLHKRRSRPDHGDIRASRHVYPRQRPAGFGDPGSPHPGCHPDDLVQGRLPDETPGKSGLAHFLEHLMFKGTSKHPVGEFSQTVLRIGGNENAFTSTDYTGYYQRVPREQLAKMMEFEADRMTGLILKDENVLPERDVVLEEYNMRVANNPEARLTEQIMAAPYLNHPYGLPVIGWPPAIEQPDPQAAL